MAFDKSFVLLVALPLALAACGRDGTAENSAAPDQNQAAAGSAEKGAAKAADNGAAAAGAKAQLASQTDAEGVFKGFQSGDHLWAEFDIPGREAESTALVESIEMAAFLNAHKGKKLRLQLRTVNTFLDPPGEKMDVTKIEAAQSGDTTAQAWWKSLTAEQRAAAERGVDEVRSSSSQ